METNQTKTQSEIKMYERTYGEKHDNGMDIKDIAKAVRQDIKDAQKAKTLPQMKISVTIERYSGGQSLNLNIKEFPIQFINIYRMKLQTENSNVFVGNLPDEHPAYELYTPLAKKALETLKSMVGSYNYDGSETMTDYFDVNFYSHIGFDWRYQGNHEKELSEKADSINWPNLWSDFLN